MNQNIQYPSEATKEMNDLQTQEIFEQLIGRAPCDTPLPDVVVIYFTAKWCTACKKLDLEKILAVDPTIVWFKCDIDQNEYTPGYCSIRQIPTFMCIQKKKIMGQITDSRTDKVIEWLKSFQ